MSEARDGAVAAGGDERFVLLVEDESLIAMVAEDNLHSLGFGVICVETGADALTALADRPGLALAIIDVGLPDIRGDDLAAQVRRQAPHLPIVIASGYDSAPLNQRFAGDDAVTILAKPYSEFDLHAAMTNLGLMPLQP
jgi:CheY-like chemotaxis protein